MPHRVVAGGVEGTAHHDVGVHRCSKQPGLLRCKRARAVHLRPPTHPSHLAEDSSQERALAAAHGACHHARGTLHAQTSAETAVLCSELWCNACCCDGGSFHSHDGGHCGTAVPAT